MGSLDYDRATIVKKEIVAFRSASDPIPAVVGRSEPNDRKNWILIGRRPQNWIAGFRSTNDGEKKERWTVNDGKIGIVRFRLANDRTKRNRWIPIGQRS